MNKNRIGIPKHVEDDPLEIVYLYFGILKNILVTVSPEFSEDRNT